jgi:hypothetical protein
MRTREENEFLSEMRKRHLSSEDVAKAIRSTLINTMGEPAAVAALSYTGDGGGDIDGFAQRVIELFGDGAVGIFHKILAAIPATDGIARETESPLFQRR